MKKIALLLSFVLFVSLVFAGIVPVKTAKNVALNKNHELKGTFQTVSDDVVIVYENSDPVYYVFNLADNSGYIIVSAEDVTNPVLGYSYSNSFNSNNLPVQLNELLNGYKEQIVGTRINKSSQSSEIRSMWIKYGQAPKLFS
ncbi:MAG: hypothetical protein C0594_04255, partial [Marinilabiliales bacterium]